MNASTPYRTSASKLGEHLVVLLLVAILLVVAAMSVPAVIAQTTRTTQPAQERVNLPIAVAAELERER